MTVSEWINVWFGNYKTNLNPDYITNYKAPFKRLEKALGTKLVKNIREVDLQKELNTVSHMSQSTIDNYYNAMKNLFSKARKNKIIIDDPSEDIQVPQGKRGKHRALARWESDFILENWYQCKRVGLWAMIMLLCGLRRGEMMALSWENIDLEARGLTVKEAAVIKTNQAKIKDHTKTNAGMRTLPICEPLYNALLCVPEERRRGRVCVSEKGLQLSQSAYERGWNTFLLAMERILNGEPPEQKGRRIDIEKKKEQETTEQQGEKKKRKRFSLRSHDLRYTFATALYDAGIDVKSAQYYLGHADIRMTLDLYTQLSSEKEKESRTKLTSYLDKWLKNDESNGDVVR